MAEPPDTERASALYQKGREAIDGKDLHSAISLLQQSAQLAPHFKTFELLGEGLLDVGRPAEAVTALTASVEIGNKPFRALYLLACAFNACGDKERAVENLHRAIEANPEYKTARSLLESLTDDSK